MVVVCEICNVQVPSDVVMRDHIKGRKHQQLSRAADKQKREAECSVYVRGFEKETSAEALRKHFNNFGEIQDVYVDKEKGMFAIVRYVAKESAEYVLRKAPIYLGNRRLTITPKRPKKAMNLNQQAKKEEAAREAAAQYEMLREKLIACPSVSAQMILLQEELQLADDDLKVRRDIQDTLQAMFDPMFPGCHVYQFGSSVNGFGMKGCDLDLFLDVDAITDDRSECGDAAEEARSKVRSFPDNPTVKEQITLIGQTLWRARETFCKIITIPSARCPLVQTLHKPSSISCDLSVTNKLALVNTLLLKQFADSDPRIRPLVYTIRYWAKRKCFGRTLTSYALMLLVFFYLQNVDHPLLPTVHHLADVAEADEQKLIDGCDCSFGVDSSKWRISGNDSNLEELLRGFFQFYAEFDLSALVVCPRTGETVDVVHFRELMACDPKLSGFKISSMCVQDPFVLSHNTTSEVAETTRQKFLEEVRHACGKLKQSLPCRGIPSDRAWGLTLLFSDEILPLENPFSTGGTEIDGLQYSFQIIKKKSPSPGPHTSLRNVPSCRVATPEVCTGASKWRDGSIKLIRRIMTDVLHFEMKEHRIKQDLVEALPAGNTTDVTFEGSVEDDADFSSGKTLPQKRPLDFAESPEECKRLRLDSNPESSPSKGVIHTGADVMKQTGVGSMLSVTSSDLSYSKETSAVTCSDQSTTEQSSITRHSDSSTSEQSSMTRHLDPSKSEQASVEMFRDQSNSEQAGTVIQHVQTEDSMNQTVLNRDSCTGPEMERAVRPRPLCKFSCWTHYQLWLGRNKIRKQLARDTADHSQTDDVVREIKVSELVMESQTRNTSPIVGFELSIWDDSSLTDTSLLLTLRPSVGQKQFSCVFPFLKSFVVKLADKC